MCGKEFSKHFNINKQTILFTLGHAQNDEKHFAERRVVRINIKETRFVVWRVILIPQTYKRNPLFVT